MQPTTNNTNSQNSPSNFNRHRLFTHNPHSLTSESPVLPRETFTTTSVITLEARHNINAANLPTITNRQNAPSDLKIWAAKMFRYGLMYPGMAIGIFLVICAVTESVLITLGYGIGGIGGLASAPILNLSDHEPRYSGSINLLATLEGSILLGVPTVGLVSSFLIAAALFPETMKPLTTQSIELNKNLKYLPIILLALGLPTIISVTGAAFEGKYNLFGWQESINRMELSQYAEITASATGLLSLSAMLLLPLAAGIITCCVECHNLQNELSEYERNHNADIEIGRIQTEVMQNNTTTPDCDIPDCDIPDYTSPRPM